MGGANTKPSLNSPPRGSRKPPHVRKPNNGRRIVRKDSSTRKLPTRNGGTNNSDEGKRQTNINIAYKVERKGGSSGGSGESDGIVERVRSMKLAVEEETVDGWPKWLTDNIPREVLQGLVPKSADSYDKIDKVGQGTYSNVYKARDRNTGKIVALKKVRFDTSEPESVKFMAREIMILQKLDHPNIVKLEGLATSRMQYSLYLVFDYMLSDLSRVISRPGERLTEPQIKCYMQQLLSGLQHCHERGILHRDIKGSNLLIDKDGMLKIADFGLANYSNRRHLTSRVVTLWYRAPELLLGATEYGVGIDLWSAGTLMAEMFAGRPIMPGRTEVEQLHKIFKLCGTPTDDYWKKSKAPATFRPPQVYKPSLQEVFRNFPPSSIGLLKTLLSLDPVVRGSANSALQDEFFHTSPLACDLSGLPMIYKEEDDPPPIDEKKRHRSSRMRQRSKTQKERPRKDLGIEKPKEELGSPRQEVEKRTELNLQMGSSANSTSSSNEQQQNNIPLLLHSPSRKDIITYSEAHPNATKNIKNRPPLPITRTKTIVYDDDDDIEDEDRFNRVYKGISKIGSKEKY